MTDLKTAAQQALEALEAGPDVDPIFAGEAEAALRAALAEPTVKESLQVESAFAENATTQQQLEEAPPSDYRRGYWDGFEIGKREGRIEAENALAEPVQEPDPGEYHGWVLREVLFEKGEPVGRREPVQEPGVWTPVTDALPQSGVKVLACYRNRLGNLRRIRAMWTAAKTEEASSEDAEACSEYDEATDTYYVTEGWYECIDNWGDYSSVAVTEGEVTHWMPLPPDPDSTPPQRPAEPVQEPDLWGAGYEAGYAAGVAEHDPQVLQQALDEADRIMGHDDEATEWRERWGHLFGVKSKRPAEPQGCDHCNHWLYAGIKCRMCGRVTEAAP